MNAILNRLDTGPHALLAAIFDLAWKDWRDGNGHAQDAEAFLRHPGTIQNLEAMGVDPAYYRAVLDADDVDHTADVEARILALNDWGYGRAGIAFELWNSTASRLLVQVSEVLEAADARDRWIS